jgi:hypothetical protein
MGTVEIVWAVMTVILGVALVYAILALRRPGSPESDIYEPTGWDDDDDDDRDARMAALLRNTPRKPEPEGPVLGVVPAAPLMHRWKVGFCADVYQDGLTADAVRDNILAALATIGVEPEPGLFTVTEVPL